ncbi:hypothetical protein EUGRSUZ_E03451 [Eucalyptus grandis]|uniref:Uncharacterized protein n=2 Tax=Eucalyptus grandis TaxID=71139 RepID=A0ACC3KZL6_EUCGR|nr:hypothetical protein EUGRSUZ_E03451 [Eucalyptus grandis]
MHQTQRKPLLKEINEFQNFLANPKGFPVCSSQNISKSQYTQCQIAAKKHKPENTICAFYSLARSSTLTNSRSNRSKPDS